MEEGRSALPTPHPPGISIRLLDGMPEFQECVKLQRLIWGKEFQEQVPASLLQVLGKSGGVVAGAWSEGERGQAGPRLVGFVVGLPGWLDGAPVHWSDMLGVDPHFRGVGVGAALKWFQRRLLLTRGVERVYWSFDPLEARNARLNLVHLGAQVVEFVPDMYGSSASPLHQGLATDRLVVCWELKEASTSGPGEAGNARFGPPTGAEGGVGGVARSPLRIPIPADIQHLKDRHPAVAREVQAQVRTAFLQAFDAGFHVSGFLPEIPAYILSGA